MSALIKVTKLRKDFHVRRRYDGFWGPVKTFFSAESQLVQAVKDLSFEIGRGELVGYLGPNGAGKSTTIKMITGILHPTGGSLSVDGLDPFHYRRELMQHMSILFGQRSQLWWDLPAIDSFNVLQKIYAIPPARYRENLAYYGHHLEIQELLNTPVRQMSLGQRMRCEIAAALLHDPEILLLDEPTIGLDIVAKTRIRSMLRFVNQERQTTILLTTHDLADVESVCSRIMIIDRGELIYDGSQEEIRRQFGRTRVLEVEFRSPAPDLALAGTQMIRRADNKAWIEFDRERLSASDLITAITRQHDVLDLTIHEARIETIVAGIYEGTNR